MGHVEEKLDPALDYLQFCLQGTGCLNYLGNENRSLGDTPNYLDGNNVAYSSGLWVYK